MARRRGAGPVRRRAHPCPDGRRRGACRRVARADDPRGEARTAAAARGTGRGRLQPRAGSAHAQGARGIPAERAWRRARQHDPAGRRRGVTTQNSAPARVRRDPWLPHGVSDPARRSGVVGSRRCRAILGDRGCRNCGRGSEMDLCSDGRHRARSSLGPHCRGRRRGSVSRDGVCARTRARLPGARHVAARSRDGVCQALRRLRCDGGRARLQHDRYLRARPPRNLPAAVPGRHRRRRRAVDHERVQRPERRAHVGQPVHADRRAAQGVEVRRARRQRLGVGRPAARSPRRRRRRRGGRAGARRRAWTWRWSAACTTRTARTS